VSRSARAIGIDGCPGGWVAAIDDGPEIAWQFAAVEAIGDLLLPGAVVAVDMPIGLVPAGLRDVDALLRRELPGAGSRVFTTPPRAVLELGLDATNDEVQRLSRSLTGKGVSRQALGLATRILALDDALGRTRAAAVVEVHPELSYATMRGHVLPSKHGAAGVSARIEAVRHWRTDAVAALDDRPRRVPLVDALDALAALWTAIRLRDGRARVIPPDAVAAPRVVV
jgi:predicted RNase H-like nuclease